MLVDGGNRSSICPTCFGSAGLRSICLNFRSDRSGSVPDETLFLELSW